MSPEDKAQQKYHMLRNDYTTEELEMELERREREKEKPEIIENPNFENLKICVKMLLMILLMVLIMESFFWL